MKIQYLSIVFIIIALPIILITSVYNSLQIKTIQLQKDYNDKLITATYDTMRAYQINTENNEYATASDSKRRDIEAAATTFITSLSTGLGVGGYGTNYLKPYIPAILFTLYDGYYIYAPTYIIDKDNPDDEGTIKHTLKPFIAYAQRYVHGNIDIVINYTLDNYITVYGKVGTEYVRKSGYLNYYLLNTTLVEETEMLSERLFVTKETFAKISSKEYECWEDDYYIYIIKDTEFGMYYVPEIIYADRTFTKSESKKQWLNVVGNEKEYYYYDDEANYQRYYLNEKTGNWFKFNKEEIVRISDSTVPSGTKVPNVTFELSNIDYGFDTSKIEDNEYVEGYIKEYNYRYEGKVKVYYDAERRQEFTYLNATKRFLPAENVEYMGDSSYYNYAKDSKEFTEWVMSNLKELTISDAVDTEGNKNIEIFKNDTAKFLYIDENNKPEEANTLFNTHKREVIKLSIETNLATAINNYDKNSVALDTSYHFKMPVIQENEWDRILSNVSIVTFLQGLPVGFKTYNNYAIITSSTNEEYLTDDSIYFLDDSHDTYHLIGCQELELTNNVVGYRNSDYERSKVTVKSTNGQPDQIVYYYKQDALPCYYCIVNRLASRARNIFDSNSNDYNWVDSSGKTAAERRQTYYKALGRERYNVVM